jgi:hypothetical protein
MYKDWEELLLWKTRSLRTLRQLVVSSNIDSEEDKANIVNKFYFEFVDPSSNSSELQEEYNGDAVEQTISTTELYRKSLFVLPYLHYASVFGKKNVFVVQEEDMLFTEGDSTFFNTTLLSDLCRQLSILCPTIENVQLDSRLSSYHASQQSKWRVSDRLVSQDTYLKLENFFRPFFSLLPIGAARNSNIRSLRKKLSIFSSFPLYAPGENSSRPLEWYELLDAEAFPQAINSKIVPHLVPQR